MNYERVKERTTRHEGRVSWLYKCTAGKVTSGVGHVFETVDEALVPNWTLHCEPPVKADPIDIRAAYSIVRCANAGRPASYYRPMSHIFLTEAEIDKLYNTDFGKFYTQLRTALPWFEYAPEPAQEALFDMALNLGTAGLLKYHNMLAACQADNWEQAAKECFRHGLGDTPDKPGDRNRETATLFTEACG